MRPKKYRGLSEPVRYSQYDIELLDTILFLANKKNLSTEKRLDNYQKVLTEIIPDLIVNTDYPKDFEIINGEPSFFYQVQQHLFTVFEHFFIKKESLGKVIDFKGCYPKVMIPAFWNPSPMKLLMCPIFDQNVKHIVLFRRLMDATVLNLINYLNLEAVRCHKCKHCQGFFFQLTKREKHYCSVSCATAARQQKIRDKKGR